MGSYWSRNSCDVVTFRPRKTQNEKKNENSHLKFLLMICLKWLSRSFRLNKLLFRNQKQYSDSLFYLHSHKESFGNNLTVKDSKDRSDVKNINFINFLILNSSDCDGISGSYRSAGKLQFVKNYLCTVMSDIDSPAVRTTFLALKSSFS